MTMQEQTSVGERAVVVNGPEDDLLDWYAIDWAQWRTTYGVYDRGSSRRRRQGTSNGSVTCRS
jgi:hypothetical protein